ncbi:MAG TPA: hypothetical protein VM716_12260 [Gemmatimonadales bacterium]|nr:hypothetical protein [Gemmatimonadales bacterium]
MWYVVKTVVRILVENKRAVGVRPVLLNLGEPGVVDITPWADRVQLIDATYAGTCVLPVIGAVRAPTAVLVRPDGYVA